MKFAFIAPSQPGGDPIRYEQRNRGCSCASPRSDAHAQRYTNSRSEPFFDAHAAYTKSDSERTRRGLRFRGEFAESTFDSRATRIQELSQARPEPPANSAMH